jgi:hypothetical protein
VRVQLLLMGIWSLAHRSVGQDGERSSHRFGGKGKKETRVSWPEALRAVRGWFEPWVMLMRYWRAFSDMPPPKELRVLLDRVFSGRGHYLYVQ